MDLNQLPLWKRIFTKNFFLKLAIYLAAFVVFLFLMDAVIMPLYTKHGQEYELPDVTDKPLQEGLETLKADGFTPIIKDSIYDEQFAPGAIIQQNPLPFSQVKKGRRVYLVVSIGEKPRYIPRLIGLTPQDAEFRLREEGFKLNKTIYEFSDFYPRGVVFNQSIPAGEAAERNQNVNITVSLGPAPTSLEVPNLVGKSLESAKKELDAVGVRLGRVKYTYRSNLVPGTVLNQSISPGHSVVKADSINLLVSTDQAPQTETQNDSTAERL